MKEQIVRFAYYNKSSQIAWRKRPPPEWSIVQEGRWGPRWLHWLVWRVATNLGMIRHAREIEERVRIIQIDRKAQSELFDEMRAACIYGFERYGFKPGSIKIVCGENEIHEIRASPSFGRMLQFDLAGPWRRRRRDDAGWPEELRIDDVPVKVIPGLQGWAVLPAEA